MEADFMTGQPDRENAAVVAAVAKKLRSGIESMERRCIAEVVQDTSAYVSLATLLDDCLAELAALNLWGEANRLLSSLLWNACESQLARGWLQNRARAKPRGYAGDYELLHWMYLRRISDEALGRLFDRYFQEQAAPQAVRNRMALMATWIAEAAANHAQAAQRRPLKIGLFGSTLGLEIREACLRLNVSERQPLRVVLVDVDPDAIEFGKQQLRGVLQESQVAGCSTNLFRLPERARSAPALSDCDCLFCPGLLDYLDDQAAAEMLHALYRRLAAGGCLVVFQFAPDNPTRAYMEWFGNWYLRYRDANQFRQLIQSAPLPDATIEFGAEALGIDLFVKICKARPGS